MKLNKYKMKNVKIFVGSKFVLLLAMFFATTLSPTKLFSIDDHPNSLSFGLGLGQNLVEHHTEFSLMLGYNRYIETTPKISVGALVEGVFSSHSFAVFGIPIGFYPVEHLKLWVAPCFTYAGGGKEYFEEKGVTHFHSNNQFMLKFGGGYSIPIQRSRFSVMPFIEGGVISSDFILGIGAKMNMYFTDDFFRR